MRLFKVRYWDYSNQHFQYKGHICLSSSIVWGFFSVMMVYVVQPQVERFVFWLNSEFVSVMTFLITVCMVYDFAGAFRKAMDLRKLLDQAEQHGRECRVVPDPQPGFPFYDCQGRDRLRRDPGSDQEASAGSFEREEEPTVSRFSQKFHILFVDFVRTLTYNR